MSAAVTAGRVHTHYVEPQPDGSDRTSPTLCHASRSAATAFVRDIDGVAGPDTAAGRTWHLQACTCPTPSTKSEARYVSLP